MIGGAVIDDTSSRAFDVAWLDARLCPASEYGLRAFAKLHPFAPGEEAAACVQAQRIARVAASLEPSRLDAARDTLRRTPDAAGALARATMGETLADVQFLELQRCFDAMDALDAHFANGSGVTPCGNDAVREAAAALEPGRSGAFGFYLADAFDSQLEALREAASRAQAQVDAVRGRSAAAAAAALGRDDISGNEFIVMRADLRGEMLPAGVRVVREAATYVVCELDADDATLAAIERRDRAQADVAHAEERARERLSQLLRAHAASLDAAMRALGDIDVLVAQARFVQSYDCVVAEYSQRAEIAFTAGRYLPLAEALGREGRAFTPLDVELDGVAVLTGPNMGGKSVALRTCGFVALCAAYGIPVPARSVRVALFDDIAWLGIGGEDDRGSLLSSFATEVVRLRALLERDARRRLLLVDEFARTTTPQEGKALLIAVIERLRACGICGIVATHLGGIARATGAKHLAVRGLRGIPQRPEAGDLHGALAALADSMDYSIAQVNGEGEEGSDAIALAALLGLDEALIAAASAAFSAP
ncbi:MAG: lysine 5,6-aminomutase reactivase ATPase KamC [Vulcanimicrobiaceae bacterium]